MLILQLLLILSDRCCRGVLRLSCFFYICSIIHLLICTIFSLYFYIYTYFYRFGFTFRLNILQKSFFLWFDSPQFVHYNKNNVTYIVTKRNE